MHDSSLSQVIFEQFLTKLDLISQEQKLVLQMGQHFLQLVFPAPKFFIVLLILNPKCKRYTCQSTSFSNRPIPFIF